MRAPYPVTLTQADDGTFIVRVGCKTLTFPNLDMLGDELRAYFAAPGETIVRYEKAFGWPSGPAVESAYSGLNDLDVPIAGAAVGRIPASAYQGAIANRPIGG